MQGQAGGYEAATKFGKQIRGQVNDADMVPNPQGILGLIGIVPNVCSEAKNPPRGRSEATPNQGLIGKVPNVRSEAKNPPRGRSEATLNQEKQIRGQVNNKDLVSNPQRILVLAEPIPPRPSSDGVQNEGENAPPVSSSAEPHPTAETLGPEDDTAVSHPVQETGEPEDCTGGSPPAPTDSSSTVSNPVEETGEPEDCTGK